MTALLVSVGIVALAEVGDKTQLLALVLAARYRAPVPIILGILAATLLNHTLAGALGTWLTGLLGPATGRWVLGLSFVAMGLWTLKPDTLGDARRYHERLGVFGATLVAFFVVEMGDKTQIATIALAARFHQLAAVVAGTTIGMLVANVPAVLLGDVAAHRLPVRLIHGVAAALFVALGILVLAMPGGG
jgi:putative Ca2+/H+ antiporter (TMEM165/GDT1 family)